MENYLIRQNKYNELLNRIIRTMYLEKFLPDTIVGISGERKGSCIPAANLASILDTELVVYNRLHDDVYHLITRMKANSNILIVTDMNDTGKTLTSVQATLDGNIFGSTIKYGCIVDNLQSTFKVDYYGMEFDNTDPMTVEFWWENF